MGDFFLPFMGIASVIVTYSGVLDAFFEAFFMVTRARNFEFGQIPSAMPCLSVF